jgi:ribonuclease HII
MSSFFLSEIALRNKHPFVHLITLDEVGRGSLAGPVLVCATVWAETSKPTVLPPWLSLVKDSKALSPQQREICFCLFFQEKSCPEPEAQALFPLTKPTQFSPFVLEYPLKGKGGYLGGYFECRGMGFGMASALEIDASHIWKSTQLAAARSLYQISQTHTESLFLNTVILVDGHLPFCLPSFAQPAQQVSCVKADAHFVSTGLSSVLAKVKRDRFMTELAREYPQYGFEKHKGYGTKEHFKNILSKGVSVWHRSSFLKSIADKS